MKRPLLLALALGLAGLHWLPAVAGDKPRLIDPLPFDHGEHAAAFSRAGVGCVDCHLVGLREAKPAEGAPEVQVPDPPLSSCHGCHQAELPKAPRAAPDNCTLCHADVRELMPADHDLDWIAIHGDLARSATASCSSCHEPATCFDCHDRRGAGSENPHEVGFRSTHGVEARMDPRQCSSCHTEASCTTCHTGGALPW